MHITDDMHSKSSGKKKKDRADESKDDIMKRMNDLSEEIGERHDESKYELSGSGKERIFQMAVLGMVVIFVAVASFVLSCQNKKGSDSDNDDGRGRNQVKQSRD